MENNYSISGRTLDNAPREWLGSRGSGIRAIPRGTVGALGLSAKFGFVGFYPLPSGPSPGEGWIRMAGLNEVGLSCDEQHLSESAYQDTSLNESANLKSQHICEWAVMNFKSCREVHAGLEHVHIVRGSTPTGPDSGHHYTFRDADGASLILEVLDGRQQVHYDLNDGGTTGFGVTTNSPDFTWQLRALRLLREKLAFARPGVSMPGNWYSDERFQRIWLTKSAMPKPADTQEAIAQALAVMNTISLPMGVQLGTDSDPGDGGDYTMWGAIYDHREATILWRTARNPLLQRLRLSDLQLETGRKVMHFAMDDVTLPWFSDASPFLRPENDEGGLQV